MDLSKGEKGDTGARGLTRKQGPQGAGQQGDRGFSGQKGAPGNQGAKGDQGLKGSAGHTWVRTKRSKGRGRCWRQ